MTQKFNVTQRTMCMPTFTTTLESIFILVCIKLYKGSLIYQNREPHPTILSNVRLNQAP